MSWRGGALALWATLGACVGQGESTPLAEVTDSAGVRIVRHDLGGLAVPVHRTVGEPDLEIGVVDGDAAYTFSRIVDLRLLEDGRLVVSDANAAELRVFGADGRHRTTLGQQGDGPGEFASGPVIAGISGDTVFAYDLRSGRVTSFTLDGALVESSAVRSGTGNRIRALHRRGDGDYLAVSGWALRDAGTELHDARLELDSIVVERLDPRGAVRDTMEVMADRDRIRLVQERGAGILRVVQADPPYLPHAVLESNGEVTVMGRSDAFELALTDDAGSTTLLRVRGAEHPAGRAEIREHQEARVRADLGDEPLDPLNRQLLLDHLPERLPAFDEVLVSGTGDVWVAKSTLDDGSARDWLVFSADGSLLGSVRTPPGVRVLDARGDVVVGVARDELDVPFIRRYPLAGPGEGR